MIDAKDIYFSLDVINIVSVYLGPFRLVTHLKLID
jgi:hypothetical protein